VARPHVLGRGLATEGAVASARYGFDELGLERIISIIQPANVASHRVAEKAGLTLRGDQLEGWRSGLVRDRPLGPGSKS
jgi:RimJ/RimL family protein N-acetyltransferase